MQTTIDPGTKPRLRGVLHHWAAVAAFGAGGALVSMAPSARSAAAAAVFSLSLVTLFAVSATYHRVNWAPVARARMRRADHASIFVLIAGTYTPIALLGLPPDAARSLLMLAWGGAVLGVLQSLFWVSAPKFVAAVLAVAVGWTIVPYVGVARQSLGAAEIALIFSGGAAYTLGAVAYATKKPDLAPGVFGYHEFFHALTLVGAVLHFAVIVLLLRRAA